MLRGWVWVQESDGLGEETPPESLSFCHQATEALTRWQQSEKTALLSNIQRHSVRKQLFLFEISQQKCRPRMFTGGLNATVLGLVCSLCLGILGCFSPCGFSAGKHWLYSSMHINFIFYFSSCIYKESIYRFNFPKNVSDLVNDIGSILAICSTNGRRVISLGCLLWLPRTEAVEVCLVKGIQTIQARHSRKSGTVTPSHI